MKKLILALLVILLTLQVGCRSKQDGDKIFPNKHYTSSTSAADCFLCSADSSHESYWQENNVGIISLNTFEVMPVKIIQYGDNGTLIQENTGTFVRRSFKSDANGFYASQAIDSDRGYAFASISFYDDETLDVEKTANFLCEDCLNQLTEKIYKNEFGLGIINFETKEIRTFEENTTGFGSGDFYIHCDFRERDKETDTRNLDLLIFYCPLRYENEA